MVVHGVVALGGTGVVNPTIGVCSTDGPTLGSGESDESGRSEAKSDGPGDRSAGKEDVAIGAIDAVGFEDEQPASSAPARRAMTMTTERGRGEEPFMRRPVY